MLQAKIAEAGGGKFFSAASSAELAEAIVQAATVNFRLLDSQEKTILKDTVGSRHHKLKVGSYQLIIDTEPQVVMDGLRISKNQETAVELWQEDEEFKVYRR